MGGGVTRRIQGLGLKVWGLGSRWLRGLRLRVEGILGARAALRAFGSFGALGGFRGFRGLRGFGFRVSGSKGDCLGWGFRFGVQGFGFGVCGFGVWGFGRRVWNFGLGHSFKR